MAGADPNALLADGQPLICRAARAGRGDFCSLLIEFNADIDRLDTSDDGTRRQSTALIQAAIAGHVDVVQLLHQHGASVSLSLFERNKQKTGLDVDILIHAHALLIDQLLFCVISANKTRLNRQMCIGACS